MEEFRLLSALLREKIGLHFPEQKRESVAAKVLRRVAALGLGSTRLYYRALLEEPSPQEELGKLSELLANHETYFFREPTQLEAFLGHAAPALAQAARAEGRSLRVLSLGCSSGEEPYSFSILEKERRTQDLDVKLEIHGADLCRGVLERARQGVYTASAFRTADPEWLERYFHILPQGGYRLREPIRRTVAFHKANLLDLSEMSQLGLFDAIFCRNVFIYFEDSAVQRALAHIGRCLIPGGLLLLGQAESLLGRSARFEPVSLGGTSYAYRSAGP